MRKRQRARREILDATRAVLLRDGVDSVTVEGVASELGMSKGSLYYYFDSKEQLIDEFLDELVLETVEPLRDAVRNANDGLDAVDALIRTFTEDFADSLDRFRSLFVAPQLSRMTSPAQQERIDGAMRDLFSLLEERIAASQAAGVVHDEADARRAAVVAFFSALGLVSALSLFDAAGTRSLHNPEELVTELTRAFRVGLRRADNP